MTDLIFYISNGSAMFISYQKFWSKSCIYFIGIVTALNNFISTFDLFIYIWRNAFCFCHLKNNFINISLYYMLFNYNVISHIIIHLYLFSFNLYPLFIYLHIFFFFFGYFKCRNIAVKILTVICMLICVYYKYSKFFE